MLAVPAKLLAPELPRSSWSNGALASLPGLMAQVKGLGGAAGRLKPMLARLAEGDSRELQSRRVALEKRGARLAEKVSEACCSAGLGT